MTWLSHIDDPRFRLAWVIPFSLLCWLALLIGFAWLAAITGPPHPAVSPADVRIIELPASAGLKPGIPASSAVPALKSKFQPTRARPHLRTEKLLASVRPHPSRSKARKVTPSESLPPSPSGTAKVSNELRVPRTNVLPESSGAVTGTGQGVDGGLGSGNGGLGSGTSGARAIYAPEPTIPDNLREEAFQTVAVARFKVSYDGKVDVTLITPTESVQLNELLLETLKRWRFFPATKSGVPIDSQFDLRIPISVE
jgi:protein TonB